MGQKLSRSFKKLVKKQPQVEEVASALHEVDALPPHEEIAFAHEEEIALAQQEEIPLFQEPLLENPLPQQPLLETPLLHQPLQEKCLLTDDRNEEREVKKANRELHNLTSKMDDLQKIETLQKRVTEHLADMKRLERDNLKNKKRGDILQKEKDHSRSELSKSVTLREKLEKLCRELQRENNRLKVRLRMGTWRLHAEC